MTRKESRKSHTDLGRIQTGPLGISHNQSLPSCWICKGSLILEACGDGRIDMLDFPCGGRKLAVLFF